MSGPSLMLVEDDDAYRTVMTEELTRLGFIVHEVATGTAALRDIASTDPQIVVLDLMLPDMDGLQVLRQIRGTNPRSEVVMLTGQGSIESAVEAIRAGALDYITKPCPLVELEMRLQRALERQKLRERTELLENALSTSGVEVPFVGASPPFVRLRTAVERAASSDVPVLLLGETGSGKGVAARFLHTHSPRCRQPFVLVDCAALRGELLQSELFGHERGAFTGATAAKAGLFEVADGGTVFLDEIGELLPAAQAQLLRFLDDSTFRHVGGTVDIRVNVRVVSATNRDLETMVRKERFRTDLLYRLRAVTITVPGLRERLDDVPLLVKFFMSQMHRRHGAAKDLSPETMQALVEYDWPGNVRQLHYALESAYVMAHGSTILPEHLPISRQPAVRGAADAGTGLDDDHLATLEELECAHIKRVLKSTDGHRARAAAILGISERSLYRMLQQHRIIG